MTSRQVRASTGVSVCLQSDDGVHADDGVPVDVDQ